MDRKAFFDHVRKPLFGGRLTAKQVEGMNALLDFAPRDMSAAHLAYPLATTFHETNRAMVPNVENLNYTTVARIRAVWPSRFPTDASAAPFVRNPRGLANHVYNGRMGNRTGTDDGWNFRGRGLPHLTGRDNYARASRVLGVDFVAQPDLALEPEHAARILYAGMSEGWFTGKRLSDYFSATKNDPVNARRIVNGTDCADLIAGYHRHFLDALMTAGYKPGQADHIPPPPDIEPPAQPTAPDSWWRRLLRWLGV